MQASRPVSLWDRRGSLGKRAHDPRPGIVAIHATTAANSLHYIFHASGDDLTRRLALLQAVGWQPLYRDRLKASNPVEIDAMKHDDAVSHGDEAVGEIFTTINQDRAQAAAKTMAYLAGADRPSTFSTPLAG